MSFQLSIITPGGKVFDEIVDSVSAPGLLGGFEVYSSHAAMLIALKEGKIKVRKGGTEKILNSASGILEVQPDHNVLVLVDSASSV